MTKELPFAFTANNVADGIDLELDVDEDCYIDLIDQPTEQSKHITIHIRRKKLPREGSRVTVSGRLVKVAARRYDKSGNLWLLDEDTKVWVGA